MEMTKNIEQNIKITGDYGVTFGRKTLLNGDVEFYHFITKNGELYDTINVNTDYIRNEDDAQDTVAELIYSLLKDEYYDIQTEADGQLVIEGFTYRVWVAVGFVNGKVVYNLSTVHSDTDINSDDDFDKNQQERKTWKGLINYINKFMD